jgi:hypothetical protein
MEVLNGLIITTLIEINSGPLYNVLLIVSQNGVSHRRGIGKIHVDAFDKVMREKRFVLG